MCDIQHESGDAGHMQVLMLESSWYQDSDRPLEMQCIEVKTSTNAVQFTVHSKQTLYAMCVSGGMEWLPEHQ